MKNDEGIRKNSKTHAPNNKQIPIKQIQNPKHRMNSLELSGQTVQFMENGHHFIKKGCGKEIN